MRNHQHTRNSFHYLSRKLLSTYLYLSDLADAYDSIFHPFMQSEQFIFHVEKDSVEC